MAHSEQRDFVLRMRRRFPEHFQKCRVLEVGSRNINGSVRELFAECEFIGIDAVPGDCVDVVALGHQFDAPRPFDTVISCEAFEHDPHFPETVANIHRLLRAGGVFIATCGGRNRAEHGTTRTQGPEALYGPDAEYYGNVSVDRLLATLAGQRWASVYVEDRDGEDTYWYAVKG